MEELNTKVVPKTRLAYICRSSLWLLAVLLLATAVAVRAPRYTTGVRAIVAVTLLFSIYVILIHLVRLAEIYPKTLFPAAFFLGLCIIWAVLASKPADVYNLQKMYLHQLDSFRGARYTWGGETHEGIDCSGLARVALWQSVLKEGIQQFNPRMMGGQLWAFWWRDMSARDMLECRYGYTKEVGYAAKLAGRDNSDLDPGDLAVTTDGSHVMIYVGDSTWIEANPEDGKVVSNKATADSNRPYFNTPVKIMRWWIMNVD